MKVFKKIKNAVSGAVVKTTTKVKKYSPEILMGVGIVTFGATIYASCKATTKVTTIMKEYDEQMNEINVSAIINPNCTDGTVYTKEDAEKDRKITKVQTSVKVGKAVLPAATLAAISILSFLCAFRIVKKRYLVAVASGKVFESAYNTLVKNVRAELGDEKAEELITGLKKVGTDENGNDIFEPIEGKDMIKVTSVANPYGVYFSPVTSVYWDEYSDMANEFTLTSTMNTMNDRLITNGFVLLSDIYRELGFEVTPLSTRVGWTYGEKARKAREDGLNPDEYIDFRIKKIYFDSKEMDNPETIPEELKETNHFTKNTRVIYYLDFNVDGEMWKYL